MVAPAETWKPNMNYPNPAKPSFQTSEETNPMSASYRSCPTAGARRMGFTLIELLVVILVIGILMALLFPAVRSVQQSVFETSLTTEIVQLEAAVERFKDEFGFYPSDFSEFVDANGNALGIDDPIVLPQFNGVTVRTRLKQMLAKISPSHNEDSGASPTPLENWWNNVGVFLAVDPSQPAVREKRLRGPTVALWFWTTQLFKDAQYPLSGPRDSGGVLLADAEQRSFFDFPTTSLEVVADVPGYFNSLNYQIARVVQSRSSAPLVYMHNQTYTVDGVASPTVIDLGPDDLSGAPNFACACRNPTVLNPPGGVQNALISPASFQILAPGYDESFGDVSDASVYESYDNLTNFAPGRLDGYVEDFVESNQ